LLKNFDIWLENLTFAFKVFDLKPSGFEDGVFVREEGTFVSYAVIISISVSNRGHFFYA
jgi:hypothetical protein